MVDTTDPTRVGRWMSQDLITCSPDEILGDALESMTNHRIRHLPVVDGDLLVGILSSRDATRTALAPSPRAGFEPLQETKVADVMTKGRLIHVDPETHVREAAELICREKISALPVLIQGERLVGIVTSEDLLWAFLDREEEDSLPVD